MTSALGPTETPEPTQLAMLARLRRISQGLARLQQTRAAKALDMHELHTMFEDQSVPPQLRELALRDLLVSAQFLSVEANHDVVSIIDVLTMALDEAQQLLARAAGQVKEIVTARESRIGELADNLEQAQKDLDDAQGRIEELNRKFEELSAVAENRAAELANTTAELESKRTLLEQEADIKARVERMIDEEVPWPMIEKELPWVRQKIEGAEDYLRRLPPELTPAKDVLRRKVAKIVEERFVSDPENPGKMIDKNLIPDSQPGPEDKASDLSDEWSKQLKIIKRIGKGGMAKVWTATHYKYGSVVVKVPKFLLSLEEDKLAFRRFTEEVKLHLSFNYKPHPNITHVLDYELNTSPSHFLVMQYVQNGVSLYDFLEGSGPLKLEEVLTILYFMVEALEAAQKSGIIHRDVSPGNFMLTSDEAFVKLLDFGSAKDLGFVSRADLQSSLQLDDERMGRLIDKVFVPMGEDDLMFKIFTDDFEAVLAELDMINDEQKNQLRLLLRKKTDEGPTQQFLAPAKGGYAGLEAVLIARAREIAVAKQEHLKDIYSLGIVLYKMLLGKLPYPDDLSLNLAEVDYGVWLWKKEDRGEKLFDQSELAGLPEEVKEFLNALVILDWKQRRDVVGDYAKIKARVINLLRQAQK